MTSSLRTVVLAYSGGLDTSIIVPWLKETYGCRVIAFAADVGQGRELDGLERKAIATGADEFVVEDLREELARDYILPALAAGAVYEHAYLLGTALARPLIARRQIEIALERGADGVAHGCTGKGNDQVRFELTYRALAPQLRVIAPWREWTIGSREEALAYAAARGIGVPVSAAKLYSRDRNLWHCSHEGGPLEDPSNAPDPDLFLVTADPAMAPDEAEEVTIGFERGRPVSLDGHVLSPACLIETLNVIAGRHGVGRADIVENRLVGMKSRGVYETPAGTVLVEALRALESLTLDRETARFLQQAGLRYADLVYSGQWFTPLRGALDAFVASALGTTTGEVRVRLLKGSATVVSRRSPYSLYDAVLGGFGMRGYRPSDAEGFISLTSLPLAVRATKLGAAAPLPSAPRIEQPSVAGVPYFAEEECDLRNATPGVVPIASSSLPREGAPSSLPIQPVNRSAIVRGPSGGAAGREGNGATCGGNGVGTGGNGDPHAGRGGSRNPDGASVDETSPRNESQPGAASAESRGRVTDVETEAVAQRVSVRARARRAAGVAR